MQALLITDFCEVLDMRTMTTSKAQNNNSRFFKQELYRKALHIAALIIPVGMFVLDHKYFILLLGLASVCALGLEILRTYLPAVNYWISKRFGFMMRPEEISGPNKNIAFTGATWVFISAFLLALFFPTHIAASAFAMFMVGDGFAAIVGRCYGKIFWRGSSKTLEGSMAFLVSALLIVLIVPGVNLMFGAWAAVGACLAEALPGPLNDNLRSPLVAALIMVTLEYLY